MSLDNPFAGKSILDQHRLIPIFIAYLKLQLQIDLNKARSNPEYIPQYHQKDIEEVIAVLKKGICSGLSAFLGHKLMRGKFQEMVADIETLNNFNKIGFNEDRTFKDNGEFLINQGKKPGVPKGEELNRKYNLMVALLEDVLSNMLWLHDRHKIPFRDIWDEYELPPEVNKELMAILSKEHIEAKSLFAFCQKTFPIEEEVLASEIFNKEKMEKLKSIFLKSKEKAALRYLDQLLNGALEKAIGKEVRSIALQIEWDKLINFVIGEKTPELQCHFSLHLIFQKEEIGNIINQVISSLESTKIIKLRIPKHTVLIYKEGENFYFFDPNDGRLFGPFTKKSSNELTSLVLKFFPADTVGFEFGIDVFGDPLKSKLDSPLDATQIIAELLEKREKTAGDNLVNLRSSHKGFTSLHQAAGHGHVNGVEVLLKANADIAATDSDGGTPLHLAAEMGHVSIVEALLKTKADMTRTDKLGESPLHRAARWGHVKVVEAMLKAGADVSLTDSEGKTLLHLAVQWGHVSIVEALLKAKADINLRDKEGRTPLHLAAKWGNVSVVEALLKANANMTATDRDGTTALHFAAQMGHIGIVETLLKAKADVTRTDNVGESPLHLAARWGHVRVVEALLKANAQVNILGLGGTPLYIAAKEGRVKVVEALLKANADSSLADSDGKTPLHLAVEGGRVGVVEALLKAKADMTRTDSNGATPLHLAAHAGHVSIVEALLKAKANIAATANNGNTPLHLAASEGHLSVVEALLKGKADITATNKFGESPLHLAARWGHVSSVEALLKAGAEVNMTGSRGAPLHLAARWGHANVVEALLKAKADMTITDRSGNIPLSLAFQYDHEDVRKVLFAAQALHTPTGSPVLRFSEGVDSPSASDSQKKEPQKRKKGSDSQKKPKKPKKRKK